MAELDAAGVFRKKSDGGNDKKGTVNTVAGEEADDDSGGQRRRRQDRGDNIKRPYRSLGGPMADLQGAPEGDGAHAYHRGLGRCH